MELRSVSVCNGLSAPKLKLPSQRLFSHQTMCNRQFRLRNTRKGPTLGSNSNRVVVTAATARISTSDSSVDTSSKLSSEIEGFNSKVAAGFYGVDPFRGKSGCVSFCGLTHQSVEAGKLVSAPFDTDKGSYLWVLGPIALISSLVVPQFILGYAIEGFLKDFVLVEIVTSLSFEAVFYIGLAIFLLVTDRIQRPYLEFSPKRWGLITGLKGYMTSAFFAAGVKFAIPIFVAYLTWPALGLPALIAVGPFLVGCVAQRLFEISVDERKSSCWPLIPILFEVYRLYQLTKAAHFIEKLMFSMKDLPDTAQLLQKNNASIAMIVMFQLLGIVCLWSFMTFLLRLFPSRPVAENY